MKKEPSFVISDHDDPLSEKSLPLAETDGKHAHWMGKAVTLARAMQGWVWPNPAVGCVIVRDDRIVGSGQTQVGGRPHAERVALAEAGELAHGASLYVTLEPCCHWGHTPPCADAIIASGIKKVFASLQDPDPRVNGGGFRKLRQAGIEVDIGLVEEEARRIMAGFFHRIATGEPLVNIQSIANDFSIIPEGQDAVLRHVANRIWICTRAIGVGVVVRQIDYSNRNPASLLEMLGRQGLTRLCIPTGDPLTSDFSSYAGTASIH